MNDLDQVEALIAATRAELEPTRADRERVGRHLGLKLAGAGIASSVAVNATAAAAKSGSFLAGHTLVGLGKLWVSTLLVTVGTGTAFVAASRALSSHGSARDVAPSSVDAPTRTSAPTTGSTARTPGAGNPTLAPIPELPSATPSERASAPSAASPPVTTRAPPAPMSTSGAPGAPAAHGPGVAPLDARAPDGQALDVELSLLHEANLAITSGNSGSALAALSRLDREHPVGTLLEEREALRIVIACQTGEATQAERLGAFRRRYVHSVYASRVESACAPAAAAGAASTRSFTDPKEPGH